MKKAFLFLSLCLGLSMAQAQKYTMVIHGGAGTILKENMSDSLEKAYHAKLKEALEVGYQTIQKGGSSVDAVKATINILEDSPLFNAGKGSVFTEAGKNELDASIMDGKTLKAGAVAGVTTIKNPINAAKLVMEKSPHVMMAGSGAEKFAKSHNLEMVPNSYFFTQKNFDRLKSHQNNIRESEKNGTGNTLKINPDYKYGTVGAVARDKNGNLAAGTSTGGMTNKKYGRIGDAPIIGAGTYADNETCAISCTGHGEYFIRNVVAYDIAAQMKYTGKPLDQVANNVINTKLKNIGAGGGLIGIDKDGNVTMPFNTSGMYRGTVTEDGKIETFLYKN